MSIVSHMNDGLDPRPFHTISMSSHFSPTNNPHLQEFNRVSHRGSRDTLLHSRGLSRSHQLLDPKAVLASWGVGRVGRRPPPRPRPRRDDHVQRQFRGGHVEERRRVQGDDLSHHQEVPGVGRGNLHLHFHQQPRQEGEHRQTLW